MKLIVACALFLILLWQADAGKGTKGKNNAAQDTAVDAAPTDGETTLDLAGTTVANVVTKMPKKGKGAGAADSGDSKGGKAKKAEKGKRVKVKKGRRLQKKGPKVRRQKPKNADTVIVNGKVKSFQGLGKDDTPENLTLPDASKVKSGACLKQGRGFPTLSGKSKGPAGDGMPADAFGDCDQRKRGGKVSRRAKDMKDKLTNGTAAEGNVVIRSKRSQTFASTKWLWRDASAIPYIFHSTVNDVQKNNFIAALAKWEEYTCIRFVDMTNDTLDDSEQHILVKSVEPGCSTTNLGPYWYFPYATIMEITHCQLGSLVHEVGHALGMTHTHARTDRDKHVTLYLNSVPENWHTQFTVNNPEYYDSFDIPYPYDSILHYSPKAVSLNGLQTVCPKDPLMELVMGQREQPSFYDISMINRMYCHTACLDKADMASDDFQGDLSRTLNGHICQGWDDQYPHEHGYSGLAPHNYCRNFGNWTGGPWCFTKNAAVLYEPCFKSCEDYALEDKPACRGYCYNGGYFNIETCACVCPHEAEGEMCEIYNEEQKYYFITCGGKIDLDDGLPVGISSPDWPKEYPGDNFCMWWIVAPEGRKVGMNITRFDMEDTFEGECLDYLEIRSSICAAAKSSVDTFQFCGDALAPSEGLVGTIFTSDEQDLVIKFYSDESVGGYGFSAVAFLI